MKLFSRGGKKGGGKKRREKKERKMGSRMLAWSIGVHEERRFRGKRAVCSLASSCSVKIGRSAPCGSAVSVDKR